MNPISRNRTNYSCHSLILPSLPILVVFSVFQQFVKSILVGSFDAVFQAQKVFQLKWQHTCIRHWAFSPQKGFVDIYLTAALLLYFGTSVRYATERL